MKHHLEGGVRKGALTAEQAEAKLAAWLEAKAGKVDAKKAGLSKAEADAKAKALKAETRSKRKTYCWLRRRLLKLLKLQKRLLKKFEAAAEEAPAVEENNEETQA